MPPHISGKTDFTTFAQDSEALLDHCLEVMRAKANDYADGQDAFLNFKVAAQVAGISPDQTLLVLLGMKISRLTQLVGKGKKAKNESVDDTLLDIINYVLLLRGMLKEQRTESSQSPAASSSPAHAPEPTLSSFSQAAPNLLPS